MSNDFNETMLKMTKCYNEIVLPAVKKLIKSNWEVYSVETDSSKISKLLDMYGGCDWLLLDKKKCIIYGVASRIQFAEKSFDTFTVRSLRDNNDLPMEFEKRKNAINNGGIYPEYTFQAYVSYDMQILSMAIIRTVDLLKFIENAPTTEKHTGEEQMGQASFLVCKWQDIKNAGYPVSIITSEVNL